MRRLLVLLLAALALPASGQVSKTVDKRLRALERGDLPLVTPTGSTTPRQLKDIAADVHGNPGTTLYVKSDTGSDSNTCKSWAYACKTILGAYDLLPAGGGTIYVANNSWVGGTVPNQGIWIMSTADPNYGQPGYPGGTNPTLNGWRPEKGVLRIAGVPSAAHAAFGKGGAIVVGGNGEGFAYSPSKPCIWITAGSLNPKVFESIQFQAGFGRSINLGVNSNGTTTGIAAYLVWFIDVTGFIYGAGFDDTNRGPNVYVGNAAWIWFERCALNGYPEAAGPANGFTAIQRKSTILVLPPTGLSSMLRVTNSILTDGPIAYDWGGAAPFLSVADVDWDSSGSHALLAPIYITFGQGVANPGRVVVSNIDYSDFAAPVPPTIQVNAPNASDPTARQIRDSVHVYGGPNITVKGPATLHGNAIAWTSMTSEQQIGSSGDEIVGFLSAAHRGFPPVTALSPNLAAAWNGGWAGATTTPGQRDPAGGTNGVQVTTAALSSFTWASVSATWGVGDYLLAGIWLRCASMNATWPYDGLGPLKISNPNAGLYFDGLQGNMYGRGPSRAGCSTGEWGWYSWIGKVTATPGGALTVTAYTNIDVPWTIVAAFPVAIRIPAGDGLAADALNIINGLRVWPPGATQGDVSLLPGQRLRVNGNYLGAVGGDRGDTSQTLTVGTDAQTQRWATTLTANRTVTCSTTGAVNGDTFRVVRTGLGAFTLDVCGLKTIASATAAFVDVTYNGSAWVLTGFGAL